MKTYARNPWLAFDISDFNFFCCPECAYKSKVEEVFIEHAVEIHPKSRFSKIFDVQQGALPNQNIENDDRVIHFPTISIAIDMTEERIGEKNQLDMFEDLHDFSIWNFNEDSLENGKPYFISKYMYVFLLPSLTQFISPFSQLPKNI